MSVARGEAWKKYLDHYQYLLQYPLDDEYPYKGLGEKLGLHEVTIRHMVGWLQHKPEVIAYIRSQYSPKALPDWVGEIEGDVNYRELLRSKGVTVPYVDDSSSMETVADAAVEDDAMDVQVCTPLQDSTTGDVDPRLQTPTDTYKHLPTATNKQHLLQGPPTSSY